MNTDSEQPNFFIYAHEQASRRRGMDREGVASEQSDGWENFFTEAVAFYLACDREVLERFCKEILQRDFKSPTDIRTQAPCGEGTVDISIGLRSESRDLSEGRFVIESKIGAPLGENQLEDYLGSGCFVALITGRGTRSIADGVLENPRYRRPNDPRKHYTWDDLFKIIPDTPGEGATGVLRRAFKDYMLDRELAVGIPLGLEQIFSEDPEYRQTQERIGDKLRELFADLLKPYGFKNFRRVSHTGMEAYPSAVSSYQLFGARPKLSVPNVELERAVRTSLGSSPLFSMYLVYPDETHADALYRRLCEGFHAGDTKWYATKPFRMTTDNIRLEFLADLNGFLRTGAIDYDRVGSSARIALAKILA